MRLLTYNILEGGVGRTEALCKVIYQAQADIVALQEVCDETFFYNLARNLDYPYRILGYGNQGFHVGLLSRYPIIRSAIHSDDEVFRHSLIEAQLETPLGLVGTFVAHLHPYYDEAAEDKRLIEVQTILNYMQPYDEGLSLVAGDFNAVEPGVNLNLCRWPRHCRERVEAQGGDMRRDTVSAIINAGYEDCFRYLHPFDNQISASLQGGYTMHAANPNTRLDYIFASSALAGHLQSCEVFVPAEAPYASDHLPVLAQFSI